MRYKPKSIAALHIALGGLPDKMRVEADPDIGVSATTVGELRKVTAWSENLVITTPQEHGSHGKDQQGEGNLSCSFFFTGWKNDCICKRQGQQ